MGGIMDECQKDFFGFIGGVCLVLLAIGLFTESCYRGVYVCNMILAAIFAIVGVYLINKTV